MLRTMMLGLAVLAATAGAAKPTPNAPKPAPKSATSAPVSKSPNAPADEYFGPLKFSAISVRTKINALGRNYRERWQDDASIVHDALLVESAYHAWAQKYPKDRWLAPTAFHLAQLYQVLQSEDARNHARAMYEEVVRAYPGTKEAHAARLRLHQGFPALHAESPVQRTPNPYASAGSAASPAASGAPTAAPAASPSSAPGASAAPSTAPPAAPSASPKPKT